jgi:hypothetical protein
MLEFSFKLHMLEHKLDAVFQQIEYIPISWTYFSIVDFKREGRIPIRFWNAQ